MIGSILTDSFLMFNLFLQYGLDSIIDKRA